MKDRSSPTKYERVGIIKSAYACQGSEGVVEGAILLHQHDDMPDVAHGTVLGLALREDPLHIERHQHLCSGRNRKSARSSQKPPAREGRRRKRRFYFHSAFHRGCGFRSSGQN